MFEVLLCFLWFVLDVGLSLGYRERDFLDFVDVLYDLFVYFEVVGGGVGGFVGLCNM